MTCYIAIMRHNRWAPIAVAVLALSNSGAVKAEPPRLIADLQPEPGAPRAAQPHGLTRAGARVFFAADDGYSGFEPWFFDESTGRARQLADVCPGRCSSEPDTFVGLGSLVLFRAWDSERGLQLWRSDGTPRGTYPLLALPGPAFGRLVQPMALAGDIAVLLAGSGSQAALYATDGSRAGTRKISDMAADGVLTPTRFFLSTGRQVFLLAGLSDGWHLWCSDGTELGTRDLASFPLEQQASLGAEFAVASPLGQDVLFLADDGVHGQELWRTDGTPAGTVLVKDVYPGVGGGLVGSSLARVGNTIFFAGADDTHSAELWKSDGTEAGTVMVKDLNPGFTSSFPKQLASIDGTLFFRAQGSAAAGDQPWTSDGTEAGTQQWAAIRPANASGASTFTLVSGQVFFAANDGTHGLELWSAGPTLGITPAAAVSHVLLSQSQPNPMRAAGAITYSLPSGRHVMLRLYDAQGRVLRTLVDRFETAGLHRVELESRSLANGIYFYRLESGGEVRERKLVIQR